MSYKRDCSLKAKPIRTSPWAGEKVKVPTKPVVTAGLVRVGPSGSLLQATYDGLMDKRYRAQLKRQREEFKQREEMRRCTVVFEYP